MSFCILCFDFKATLIFRCVLTPGDPYMPLVNDEIVARVAKQVCYFFIDIAKNYFQLCIQIRENFLFNWLKALFDPSKVSELFKEFFFFPRSLKEPFDYITKYHENFGTCF